MSGHRLIVGAVAGAALVLAGCTGALQSPAPDAVREVTARQVNLPTELPPMKAFSSSRTEAPARSNSEIGADFLDLAFELESGRALPVLSRFEGPVTIRVTGRKASVLDKELNRLIARLRSEAGIDISRVPANADAGITVEVIPKRQLQGLVPGAACFVAPNVSGWQEYRANRRTERTDWTKLTQRTRM
jgi:outer membrane murein-binding lipoprotein Lpp